APPVAGPPLAPPVLVPPVPPVSVPPVLLPPPPVSPAAPARPPLPELCPPVPPELSLNWRSVFPHAKSNAGKLRTPSQLAPVLRRIIDRESFIADLQTVRRDTELVQCGALGTARAAEAEIDLGDRRRGDGRRHVPRLELADLRRSPAATRDHQPASVVLQHELVHAAGQVGVAPAAVAVRSAADDEQIAGEALAGTAGARAVVHGMIVGW